MRGITARDHVEPVPTMRGIRTLGAGAGACPSWFDADSAGSEPTPAVAVLDHFETDRAGNAVFGPVHQVCNTISWYI